MGQLNVTLLNATDAPDEVKEVYRKLDRYMDNTARKRWLKERKENWKAAIDNDMWDSGDKEEMKKTGQIPIVYNMCNKGVQGSAAVVTNNNPEIKALPIGSGDVYVAELLQRGLSYVWNKNQGSEVIYAGVEEKNLGGKGVFKISHDTSAGIFGKVVKEEIDPTTVYWDAESRKRDWTDSDVIIAQPRSRRYIKENYPDLKDTDLFYENKLIDEQQGKVVDTVTGEDAYAVDPEQSDTAGPDKEDKREIFEIEAWLLKTVVEEWVIFQKTNKDEPEAAKIDLEKNQTTEEFFASFLAETEDDGTKKVQFAKPWKRRVKKRILRIVVGLKLIKQIDDEGKEVDERENPYGEDADSNPVMPVIPISSQRTLTAYDKSKTFYALPLNKALNKKQAQLIHAVAKSISAPVVKDKNSRWVPADEPDKPGSYLEIDPNSAIKPYRLSAGDVDISRLALSISADTEGINDQYDLQDVTRGKLPQHQKDVSGRAVLALQDLNAVMSGPDLKNLEYSMMLMAKVELAIMLKHWPRFMWERLLEADEFLKFIPEGDTELQEQRQSQQDIDEAVIQAKWVAALDKIAPKDPAAPKPISLIDLDVKVTAGSSLPTNRMARGQVASDNFKIGLYDRKAALSYSGDPNAEAISKRMDDKEQAAAAAEANKG